MITVIRAFHASREIPVSDRGQHSLRFRDRLHDGIEHVVRAGDQFLVRALEAIGVATLAQFTVTCGLDQRLRFPNDVRQRVRRAVHVARKDVMLRARRHLGRQVTRGETIRCVRDTSDIFDHAAKGFRERTDFVLRVHFNVLLDASACDLAGRRRE